MFFRKYHKQLQQETKKTSLRREARALGREKLLAKMHSEPVRNSPTNRLQYQNSGSPFLFLKVHPMFAAIALMITLALGGGAYAAEGAVPGDTLYPVKVGINENVRARLALSEEGKSNWDARVAERRIEEAVKLSAKGELRADVEDRLTETFESQSEKLEKKIEQLKAEGKIEEAARLSSRLEAMLQVQERILTGFASSTLLNTSSTKPFPFLHAVRARMNETKKERIEIEGSVSSTVRAGVEVAATNRIREAKKKIEGVQKYISENETKLGVEAVAKAKSEIVAANKVVVDAETALKNKNFVEAFALASKAHRIASQTHQIIRVGTKVEGSVDIKKFFEDSEKKRGEEDLQEKHRNGMMIDEKRVQEKLQQVEKEIREEGGRRLEEVIRARIE